MRKLAPLILAIRAIATQRRRRVAERTARVGAVGEELAVLLGIVREFLRRRRVPRRALAVLAGGAEGA
ncbi:hypothetical protein V502_08850 [Pseudogymnoascus sp. VKM F-4520 (FW-2644)]|nr:hypothetical protein V502_08850 [Pseudogymnoascus sp. VKM F-4520 (FW-2644)]